MEFPVPLALLDADGHPEQVNLMFQKWCEDDNLDATSLRALAHNPNGVWQPIVTKHSGSKVRVRTLPLHMSRRTLLILDDQSGGKRNDELNALRARISILEQLATTDHLTGTWNRAHFDRVIKSEIARSLESRHPLSLIMFDIDHFKNVNDTFGHAVGDIVLRELTQLVHSHTRVSDLLFRWGGEEFVVLLSSTGYRHAENVAESLRQAVAHHTFKGAGAVTISLGVAEHDGNEDTATWFQRLDKSLYEGKQSGRNCVVVARRGNSDVWATESESSPLHLVWLEGYECGEPTIDAEHRELFMRANKLIDASLSVGMKSAKIKLTLEKFLAHLQHHFSDEEAILAQLQYDRLTEHQRAHTGLIRRAHTMLSQLDAGELSTGTIIEFLTQDVILRHLLTMDRAFFPLFHKASTTAAIMPL